MLLFVATVRHVYSAIEQPMSSSLRYIPYFQYIRALLAAVKSAGAGWDHCSLQLGASFICLRLHCQQLIHQQVRLLIHAFNISIGVQTELDGPLWSRDIEAELPHGMWV